MRRLLLLLLPLALLCACTAAPAEQADAPFSFYYRCAEVAYGGEDGVIRAEAAPLEPDAGLRTVVLQYLKGPASPGAAHSPARRLGAGVHWPDRGHGGSWSFPAYRAGASTAPFSTPALPGRSCSCPACSA